MKDIKDLEKLFRALGNRRRLEIVKKLNAEGPMKLQDLARLFRVSYKTVFQHTARLNERGILDKERKGGEVVYFINPDIDKIAKKLVELIR